MQIFTVRTVRESVNAMWQYGIVTYTITRFTVRDVHLGDKNMEEFNWTVENVNYINSLFNKPLLVIVNSKVMLASEDAETRLREKAIEKGYVA